MINGYGFGLRKNIRRLQKKPTGKVQKFIGEMKLVCEVMMSMDAVTPSKGKRQFSE